MENLKVSFASDFICDGVEGNAEVAIDYSWFEKDSLEFNYDLATFCAKMAILGYDTPEITDEVTATGFNNRQVHLEAMLRGLGFADIEINGCAARDEMSYYIARKEMELATGTYNLVFTAFMGSYKRQWFSNFDPNGVDREANDGKGYAGNEEKGIVHLGFADARDYMYQQLTAYMDKYPSEFETKMLMMGHSRGAAAANLLAAKLFNKTHGFGTHLIKAENLYTYCLATPNPIAISAIDDNPDYDRIFSILNPEDFVTMVFPEKNGFGKYGKKFSLLGTDNLKASAYADVKADMQQYFKEFVKGREFHPYKKGNTTAQNVTSVMANTVTDFDSFYVIKMRECFKTVTVYEYFKDTLCTFIAGGTTEEELAAVNKAMYMMLFSAVDLIGTSPKLRKISAFFVFKEGIGGATGNKIGATYFGDSHRPDTYTAYLLSLNEKALMENSNK
ncbi:MAG: hypothetical protein IJ168_11545 [Eubacterium sp.]|nr:hypothetical protein [Eubacterium sp.]